MVLRGLVKQEQLILICVLFKTTSKLDFYAQRICQTNKTLIFFSQAINTDFSLQIFGRGEQVTLDLHFLLRINNSFGF